LEQSCEYEPKKTVFINMLNLPDFRIVGPLFLKVKMDFISYNTEEANCTFTSNYSNQKKISTKQLDSYRKYIIKNQ